MFSLLAGQERAGKPNFIGESYGNPDETQKEADPAMSKLNDRFERQETEQIVERFGRPFYEKVLRDLDSYAAKWALSSIRLIPSYSANLVFRCHSELYGNAVLKIGHPSFGTIVTELRVLREYGGRRFCRVFDADPDNGVILEQSVEPGRPLREESDLDTRLAVFCSLYEDLYVEPAKADLYPTYTEWVNNITAYMSTRPDCTQLYEYMEKAKELHESVSAAYTRRLLLHGDFHHDNILRGENGEYVLIDPKGVVGDPVFDVPRFIVNEFGDDRTEETARHINNILRVLEQRLAIPDNVLRQCLFVETIMGLCWCVEDGPPPGEYTAFLDDAAFAESLLNG